MKGNQKTGEIFLAGGCLWGVQEFIRHLPGVVSTEAGRANGSANTTKTDYDGYAECVRVLFDSSQVTVLRLMKYFFEIIDPYSLNKQGEDIGKKYRTGIYSNSHDHLDAAHNFIASLENSKSILVEVLPLSNFVRSDEEHQDRLQKYPYEECHIPKELLTKYKNKKNVLLY
jgi:peptide-methionine (S)-S-oxide reductase